ncbi:P-loop containing nucleoside triphosphate hydrolase protein, partial [Syncephalis fuscata]
MSLSGLLVLRNGRGRWAVGMTSRHCYKVMRQLTIYNIKQQQQQLKIAQFHTSSSYNYQHRYKSIRKSVANNNSEREQPTTSTRYPTKAIATDFKTLGVPTRLQTALKEEFGIETPTAVQQQLIPAVISPYEDVLIRAETGSGKSFAMLLALLSRRDSPLAFQAAIDGDRDNTTKRYNEGKNKQNIKAIHLFAVPSRELAGQLMDWTQRLVEKTLKKHWDPRAFDSLVQLAIPNADKKDIPMANVDIKDGINNNDNPTTTTLSSITTPPIDLSLPWLLIGTPACLHERLASFLAHKSNDKAVMQVKTFILDEVDHLLRLPRKYAPLREQMNRQRHPKPGELLARAVFDISTSNTANQPAKPQLIACSATMNRAIRHYFKINGWTLTTTRLIDTSPSISKALISETTALPMSTTSTKEQGMQGGGIAFPKQLKHYCLLVNKATIRNLPDSKNDYEQLKIPNTSAALENNTDDQILEAVLTASELDGAGTVLVFIPSTASVAAVVKRLRDFGAPAEPLTTAVLTNEHRSASSSSSNTTDTTNTPLRLLVTTEAMGRGLDLPAMTHVFILGVPSSSAAYLHMAGRTARMGRLVLLLRYCQIQEIVLHVCIIWHNLFSLNGPHSRMLN